MAATGIMLAMIENALPSPIPGVKPGLANIVTLYVLYRFDWQTAAWVAILRILGAALLFGSFLTPGFFLSLAGGFSCLAVLRLTCLLPREWFGPVSQSLCAAFAHTTGQLLVAYAWLLPHRAVVMLAPGFVITASLFGLINGLIVARLLNETSQ
ncbi:Gx transporter family protein [Chitinivorax sp. B]|uniref:Gx transporter family protein n=1 Tax=Chitinivorax sp. B TaxID=2502235 RepID=UPI00201815E8|nr:Gx transporter family protein [Chitinivorax sp. B]